MSRKSKSVIFARFTAVLSVGCAEVFQRLYENSGSVMNPRQVLYADETFFNFTTVPAMIRTLQILPAPIDGSDGKGGISTFLFINIAVEVFQVHVNIFQSTSELFLKKIGKYMEFFDKDVVTESDFGLVMDNATWHQKALNDIVLEWTYYSLNDMAQW